MSTADQKRLVSPSDIAELVGVNRPVVSNWRKRHGDFPSPVAGTDAKPLFDRGEIEAWLGSKGKSIQHISSSALWSALNALRGSMDMESAGDLILSIATLRSLNAATGDVWCSVVDARPDDANHRLQVALSGMGPGLNPNPAMRLAKANPDSSSIAAQLVRVIDEVPLGELGLAVDSVLERASRSQIKGGAESGFIGSRTSALLTSLASDEHGTVYDMACGIGNVLVALSDQGAATRLIGHDINSLALRVARQRAILHDARVELVLGDVLGEDPDPTLAADVIVGEPPFGLRWDPTLALADHRFNYGVPPRSSSDLAWVEHAVSHLSVGGRAYVLTSSGPLFRSGAERQIRANLLSAGCVEAIVGLPAKMLPHTSIAPVLWVLRLPSPSSEVLVVDASEIANAEHKVRGYLVGDVPAAPHAMVAVSDVLASDSNLTPTHWIGAANVEPEAIAAEFQSAAFGMDDLLRALRDTRLSLSMISNLSPNRVSTVKEVIAAELVEWVRGRLSDAPEAVRPADVRVGVLPAAVRPEDSDEPEQLTRPGDVLVVTAGEIHAIVDHSGGHLATPNVEVLRPRDTSVLLPEYLAAMLEGAWNSRHQIGMSVPRSRVRDLEIPLIPLEEQQSVVQVLRDVAGIRQLAERLNDEARSLAGSIRDGVRHNVPLDVPVVRGPSPSPTESGSAG